MTTRRVSPLEHEDWVALVEKFKKGPSPEQARAVQEALEKTKHLKIPGVE